MRRTKHAQLTNTWEEDLRSLFNAKMKSLKLFRLIF